MRLQVPCNNAFITKLSPSGSVVWSTYLGGSGPDDAHAIAVDSAGNVWVAGETVSPNFPTTANAISRTFSGEIDLGPLRYGDAFVTKLDPTGSHLLYSTYLGGSGRRWRVRYCCGFNRCSVRCRRDRIA